MNRRRFLKTGAVVGGCALTGVGGCAVAVGLGSWGRKTYAASVLKQKLISDVTPVLKAKADSEIQALPVRAREEIKTWFHGKCLNVAAFTKEICASSYVEGLQRPGD